MNIYNTPISYFPAPLGNFANGLNHERGEPVNTEIAKLYKWFSAESAAGLDVNNGAT